MPSQNTSVQQALAHSVQPGTQLQDVMLKVRRARRRSTNEFELYLGQFFVLASDAFKERNGLRIKLKKAEELAIKMEEEINRLKLELEFKGK